MAEDRNIRTVDTALIVGVGLAQGLAIAALVEIPPDGWLEAHPWLARLLLGWAIFLPLTLQWLAIRPKRSLAGLMLAGVAALIALMTWHTANLVVPGQLEGSADTWLIIAGTMAWLALMTLGEFVADNGRRPADYPLLYGLVTRNVLLPVGAGLFMLLVWGLMIIWSELFELLGFKGFADLIVDNWILRPILGGAFGAATAILLSRPTLLDGTRRVISAGGSALLPLAGLIVIAFVAGVAVAGLQPLWATGHTTQLILLLAAAYAVFLNVAHDNGRNLTVLPRPLLVLTRFATCLLPVLIAISVYSFGLRVAQYGWTAERILGATALALAAFTAVAYCIASLRPRAALPHLATANMIALCGVLAIGVMINTPVFSPLHIAARDQLDRVLTGAEPPKDIDWQMFAFELGNPGRAALKTLTTTQSPQVTDEVRQLAQRALDAPVQWAYQLNWRMAENMKFDPTLRVIPGDRKPDDNLIATIKAEQKRAPYLETCMDGCDILALDLNEDGTEEMAVLSGNFPIYRKTPEGWAQVGQLRGVPVQKEERAAFLKKLRDGAARSVVPAWRDIMVDDLRLETVADGTAR